MSLTGIKIRSLLGTLTLAQAKARVEATATGLGVSSAAIDWNTGDEEDGKPGMSGAFRLPAGIAMALVITRAQLSFGSLMSSVTIQYHECHDQEQRPCSLWVPLWP